MENVRKIPNFPNYSVDSNGNVFNAKGKLLKPFESNNGYLRVSLCNAKEKHKCFSIHRLVANAFIPNPNSFTQVNHINQNKKDNRMENLEWTTPLNNLLHSNVIDKASIAKYTPVHCDTTGEDFNSIKEAEEKYDVCHSNIVACCAGRRKTAGKMKWSYIEK